jgi:uncharacterized protein
MELQENRGEGPFIDSYQSGEFFLIDQQEYKSSVLVQAEKNTTIWLPQSFAEINANAIAMIIDLKPQLVLLGTGSKMQFLQASLLEPLYAKNIGVEMMSTAAACRTYDVLMAESRDVVAALILE